MTTPTLTRPPALLPSDDNRSLSVAVSKAREYADAAHAPNTRRAYAADWRHFEQFCKRTDASAFPADPQTIVLYVTELADFAKLATIKRRIAAISAQHRERGLESPTAHLIVRRVVRGIARTIGAAQAKKSALTVDNLRAILLEIRGESLKAKRDRAVLLLGFAAALRRSEIAALDVADVAVEKRGLTLTIRRSKTDQEGSGETIAVPFVANHSLCAASAVQEWIAAASITEGPLFRSFSIRRELQHRAIDGRDVANLVQRLTKKAHLSGNYGAHSLRAGFVTSAARAKVSLDAIARTTRHKSLAVLMGYVRPVQVFDDVALPQVID